MHKSRQNRKRNQLRRDLAEIAQAIDLSIHGYLVSPLGKIVYHGETSDHAAAYERRVRFLLNHDERTASYAKEREEYRDKHRPKYADRPIANATRTASRKFLPFILPFLPMNFFRRR